MKGTLMLVRTILLALLSHCFAWSAMADTKDDIEALQKKLSTSGADAFEQEMISLLYKWHEDIYGEVIGADSNSTQRSRMLVTEIAAFKARTGATDLSAPVEAVWLISLYDGGEDYAKGWQYDEDDALALYQSGVMVSDGMPYSLRTEFADIMKAIWIDLNNRSNLDGLTGEEAPHQFVKLLFGVFDAPTLCQPGEAVIWSCHEDAKDRLISVCASPDPSADVKWVQYRIGTPDKLELVYPEQKSSPEQHFKFKYERAGDSLTFRNGQFDYAIEMIKFDESSVVNVSRDGKTVYAASCQATHPFLNSVAGHLGYEAKPERLHILPKPFDAQKPSACASTQKPLWSCHDGREDQTLSVCMTDKDSAVHLDFRRKRKDSTADVYPEYDPPAVDSYGVELFEGGGGPVIKIIDGNQEYAFLTDKATGEGSMTYSRGGFPRGVTDCTMTEFDEASFNKFVGE